jgi:hypothetical protein
MHTRKGQHLKPYRKKKKKRTIEEHATPVLRVLPRRRFRNRLRLGLRERHWLWRRTPVHRAGTDRSVPAVSVPDGLLLLILLPLLLGWRRVSLVLRHIIISTARARRAVLHRLLPLRLLHAITHRCCVIQLRWRRVRVWVRSLRIRRGVLGHLLLHRWWRGVLLWRWSRRLPGGGCTIRGVDACLALHRPRGDTASCLQLRLG